MEKNNVTIIIPSFNGLHLLKSNLSEVINTSRNASIVIIDDGSIDGTKEWVQKHFSDVIVLALPTNQGFAQAVNFGVRSARTSIVVLLNNDAVPEEGWLDPLVSHFTDPNVFAVGCLERARLNGKITNSGRGVAKFAHGLFVHSRGGLGSYTLWAAGGSAAFDRAKWNELGGMDDLYAPFYWEDIDLSYRAWKRGWKVLFEDRSIVNHVHESTIGKLYSKPKIQVISIKNQLLFFWKNITDSDLLILHILWLPVHIIRALLHGDASFLFGFFWALSSFPRVIAKRVFGVSKLGDKEVLRRACEP